MLPPRVETGRAYGLRLRDVQDDAVYVLPYGHHQLKSSNARRRIPLDLLMPGDERERLQRFVRMRLDRALLLTICCSRSLPAARPIASGWTGKVTE